MSYFCLGIGVGTKNKAGEWLEVFYPSPQLNPNEQIIAAIHTVFPNLNTTSNLDLSDAQCTQLSKAFSQYGINNLATITEKLSRSRSPRVLSFMENDSELLSTPAAYLKLHLLSHRLVKPNTLNLAGIFSSLPNVAWTNQGAIDLKELSNQQLQSRIEGRSLFVESIDKFPKMTDYVVPAGVRIANSARVRLGAYIGEGTTVMHEGFVNFNAGTSGESMIEGRISAGVLVGEGSDLGGGCSTMGTLSGGNNIIISIGKNCLIGANAGVGIPLGDRCVVEAGLYITAGSKVQLLNEKLQLIDTTIARELSGRSGLLFRRNSIRGSIECISKKINVNLNPELHDFN